MQVHVARTEIEGLKSSMSNLRISMQRHGIQSVNEDERHAIRCISSDLQPIERNLTLASRRHETLAGLARGQAKGTREEVAQIQCFSKDADTRLDEVGVIPRGVADVIVKVVAKPKMREDSSIFFKC